MQWVTASQTRNLKPAMGWAVLTEEHYRLGHQSYGAAPLLTLGTIRASPLKHRRLQTGSEKAHSFKVLLYHLNRIPFDFSDRRRIIHVGS